MVLSSASIIGHKTEAVQNSSAGSADLQTKDNRLSLSASDVHSRQ